jgi:carbamoyl-phosphate synthase small subunit
LRSRLLADRRKDWVQGRREWQEARTRWEANHPEEEGDPSLLELETTRQWSHFEDQGPVHDVVVFQDEIGFVVLVDLDENSLLKKVKAAPSMTGMDLAKVVTTPNRYDWRMEKGDRRNEVARFKISAIDFGIKHNILRLLESHGCEVTVFPATATATEILKINPDGIFLSNGPGDPAAVTCGIETVKSLLGKKPIFGICLGHQILALALGADTYKLKFGHRGCNHPVKNLETGKVEITSQNHGFAVDPETIPKNVVITHNSLNDQTVEGLKCTDVPAFSVQYHPESSPGPHDSRYLFEEFIKLMSEIEYA